MADAARLPGPAVEPAHVRLQLALAAAEVGSFDWDVATGELRWDERTHRIFGTDPSAFRPHVDSFWELVHPADVPGVERAVGAAIAHQGEYAAEFRIRRPDGAVRWVGARGRVLAGDGGAARWMLGVARDSTELRSAREVAARALEHMADAFLAADAAGLVTYLNPQAERLLAGVSGSGPATGRPLVEVWPALATGEAASALTQVRADARSRLVTTYDAATGRWWQLRLVPAADGTEGLTVFATDVTASRAGELERQQRIDAPQQARLVLAYTAALAAADSLQDVTGIVATMVLPAFRATGMLVSLLEGGRLTLAGHSGYGPVAVDMLQVLDLEAPAPIADVLRSGEPRFLPSRDAYLASYPTLGELVEETGKHAWAIMPLTVSGRTIGTLTVSFDREHDFPEEEQSLLLSVTGLVGQTIARARLRDSERRLAAELQSHLLPRELPRLTGVSASARYLPATDGMGVGGDWYDLLELPGNRIGLVIGDVQGHNMKAAAVMGQLRNALRAYAAEGHEPAAVLSRTNRLMSDLDPQLFATCCYLTLDPLTGHGEVVVAGHPPPLRRSATGYVASVEGLVGPPLGVAPEEDYRTARLQLAQGDVIVLFTDGLVEDSRRGYDEGVRQLADQLAAGDAGDLGQLVDDIVAGSLEGASRPDDVAVLAVRHDGVPEALRPAHARLDVDRSDPRAARIARDFIAGFLDEPRLVGLRDTCVLLVSEVVTNALRHTDGEITLDLWRFPDRLRVEVTDSVARAPVEGHAGLLSESGRGVPIMDALSSRWGTAPHGAGKVVWFELDVM